MKQYYHATSFDNAQKIEKKGFHLGKSGMFGGGIYVAESPESALKKAKCSKLDAIIVVYIKAGRMKTERHAHHDWNLTKINQLGYDSVKMDHCRTGPEICLYEPNRIDIIGIVQWDANTIDFKELGDHTIDRSEFQFLIKDRQVFGRNEFRATFAIMFGAFVLSHALYNIIDEQQEDSKDPYFSNLD